MTKILSWIGVLFLDYFRKVAQFSALVGVVVLTIAAAIAYFTLLIDLIIWLFTQMNSILSYVDSGTRNTATELFFKILFASGIWDGFVDAFKILSTGLLLLFTLFLTKIALKGLMHLRNTVFILLAGSK